MRSTSVFDKVGDAFIKAAISRGGPTPAIAEIFSHRRIDSVTVSKHVSTCCQVDGKVDTTHEHSAV